MRRLFYSKTLDFELNVIGYKNQGECIVFFIKTDGKAAYSGLIDCYRNKDTDVVRSLLKQEEVHSLDFVCWTHPHDDHTKGMDAIIDHCCNNKTKFWATDIMPADHSLYSRESNLVYDRLKEIHLSDDSGKMKIRYAKNLTIMEQVLCSGLQEYAFEIKSFAPDSTSLAERTYLSQEEKGNIYSIGLFINIGRYYIMLAGDVENHTFHSLEDYELEIPVDYIKIPHHGSPSAEFLVDRMSGIDILPPNIATTTLYRKGRLPKRDVLNKYRIWGVQDIISTGDVDNKEADHFSFGIVKTTFDILESKEYQIETELVGNSVQVIFDS